MIRNRQMKDHGRLVNLATPEPLFVLVEVKASLCNMNGPWTNEKDGNIERLSIGLDLLATPPRLMMLRWRSIRQRDWRGLALLFNMCAWAGK